MKIQEKPDYLIFADSAKKGEVNDFPDVRRGWGITIEQTGSKPPMEWMNGAFNRIDKNMLYLLQQGVPEWSEKVTYPVNAIIKYNGVLYTAIVENENSIPTTSTTKWKKTQAEIPIANTHQKGIVQLNSSTNSTSEADAATPFAVKKANDLAITANKIANGAVKRSGDNMTGELYINGEPVLKKRSYGIGVSRLLGETSIDAPENLFSGFLFSQQNSSGVKPFDFCHVIRSVVGDSLADIAIDILSKSIKFRGVITDRQNQLYTGDYSWIEFVTSANMHNFLPPGVPLPYPGAIPPPGFFEYNGSLFNKNKNPKLAAIFPSGRLLDLRGEFIRGWDHGRRADPDRAILSWQSDAIRNIWGSIFGTNDPAHGFIGDVISTGGTFRVNGVGRKQALPNQGGPTWGCEEIIFDPSIASPISHDNHPRNVAFMYIVKAE